jgi:hypothetical protein
LGYWQLPLNKGSHHTCPCDSISNTQKKINIDFVLQGRIKEKQLPIKGIQNEPF